MNVDYWVFTSGEKGVHELDWGVKYASPAFRDRLSLDIRYRALLSEFSLPPSLEHPDSGVGLLLLPWENGAALGFVFPGSDHQGRPNTSAVVCLVMDSVLRNFSVADAARRIWENNDLESIALHAENGRPDTLSFEGATVVSSQLPSFVSVLSWPSSTVGYLQVKGELKKLSRVIPQRPAQEKPEKTPRNPLPLKKIVLLLAVVAAVGLGASMMLNSDAPEEPKAPQPVPPIAEQGQEQNEMPQTDAQNADAEAKRKEERERREREKREEKERKEREKAEARQREEEERQKREKEAAEKEAREAEEAANAAKAKLRKEAEDIWRSLGVSDAQAGALVDILRAEKFERGDYGQQFKSVMDVAAIKEKLDGIISKKEDKGNYVSVTLTSAEAWKNFKSSWKAGTVFDTDNLSPSSGQLTDAVEDVYKKLEGILTQLNGESAELIFIFKTSNERLNLMSSRMVNSLRSGEPEWSILTKSQDFMKTDLNIFDGLKQGEDTKVVRIKIGKSDRKLGAFFGF